MLFYVEKPRKNAQFGAFYSFTVRKPLGFILLQSESLSVSNEIRLDRF